MSERVSERELLLESLPLGADSEGWAEFEMAVLGGSAACPPTVSLIEFSRGLLSGKVAEEIELHIAACRYCASCHQGLTQPVEPAQAAVLADMADLLAEPWADFPASEPLAPATPAPADDRPVPDYSGSLFTTFLRAVGPRDLLEKLRPALPEVLTDVGLSASLADAFRDFVARQLEKQPQFASAGLPGWLEQFAREKVGLGSLPRRMSPEDWHEIFVRCVLWRFPDGQDEVARFYAAAREAGMRSWKVNEQGLKRLAAQARVSDVAARQLLRKGRKSAEELARRLGPHTKAVIGMGMSDFTDWSPPSDRLPGPYAGYELVCPVGRGARASVWMAENPEQHASLSLAIKFYANERSPDAFLEHARQLRRVEGPFLGRLHLALDLRPFRDSGWPALATVAQLIEPSLERVLADLDEHHERLPGSLVLRWARQLFEGVEALHGGYGLVHGNIKPANVLLQLAAGRLYGDVSSLEGATALLGDLITCCRAGEHTPPWVPAEDSWKAPEVRTAAVGERSATAAEDLYALGLILGRLVLSADEELKDLRQAADGLTCPSPQVRLEARRELRALLFPAEARLDESNEPAVILRRSQAFAPNNTVIGPATARTEGKGPAWPETEGVPGYAILRELGRGGMGIVYEARDQALNRLVAIKVLPPDLFASRAERFRIEATALARLNHPNIRQVYGGQEGARPFLVMELIEGPSLRHVVGGKGPLSPEDAARTVEPLARALEYAHERGVLHRDIKPTNVLLASAGVPKLIDFGLAKLQEGPEITPPGTLMGTLHYLAPELLQGSDRADARTDVYGLGATLYYLLTGRPPLEAEGHYELLCRIEQTRPSAPSERRPGVPPALDAICLRCLEKRPEDRYPTTGELADALRDFAAGRTVPEEAPASSDFSGPAAPVLQVLKGPNEGSVFPLDGERFSVGRGLDCDIVVPMISVSREQARIVRVQGRFFIEDQKSRNGTFVNGHLLSGRTPLEHNDRISFGGFSAVFLAGGEAASAAALVEDTGEVLPEAQAPEQLQAVLDIANKLSKILEPDKLLPEIAESLFELFRQADRCFFVESPDGERLVPRLVKTRRPQDEPNAHFNRGIVSRCLGSAETVFVHDPNRDDRAQLCESVVDFRLRSVMCAPLCRADGTAFAAIQLDTQDSSRKFTAEDLKLLCSVAARAANALENARLLEEAVKEDRFKRDLELAHDMQRGVLRRPALPSLPGYELAAYSEAREPGGGDFFDYITLGSGRVAVCLGDVAGYGVRAVLAASRFSLAARFCLTTEPGAAQATARLNDIIYGDTRHADGFITFALVVVDPATHELTLVSAGQRSPVVYRPGGDSLSDAMPRGVTGLPLGIVEGATFDSCTMTLQPGESLIVFTDGITKAKNTSDQDFGRKGVENALLDGPGSPQALADRLIGAVKQHTAGCGLRDDLTVVVIGRTC